MRKNIIFILLSFFLVGCHQLPVAIPSITQQESRQYSEPIVEKEVVEKDILNNPIHIEFSVKDENGQDKKQEAEVTILDVKMYDNIKDTNYQDLASQQDEYYHTYQIDTSVYSTDEYDAIEETMLFIDKDICPIVEARIRIKNISFVNDFHINDFDLSYKNSSNGLFYKISAFYYDKEKKDSKEAYYIPVEIGEETEVVLAWYLASKEVNLEDYHIKIHALKKVPLSEIIVRD